MEVITPVRTKRKRVPEPAELVEAPAPAELAEAPASELAEAPAPELAEALAPAGAPPSRWLIRKSAVRQLLKQEYALPMQVREAFFAALEAKLTEDLRRSVARAREQKRTTLMASDA
jgi:hypothetical protein